MPRGRAPNGRPASQESRHQDLLRWQEERRLPRREPYSVRTARAQWPDSILPPRATVRRWRNDAPHWQSPLDQKTATYRQLAARFAAAMFFRRARRAVASDRSRARAAKDASLDRQTAEQGLSGRAAASSCRPPDRFDFYIGFRGFGTHCP